MKKTKTIILFVLFILIFVLIFLLLLFNNSFKEGLPKPITVDYNFIIKNILPSSFKFTPFLCTDGYIDSVKLTYDSSSKSNITLQNISVNANNKESLLYLNNFINVVFENLIKVDITITKEEKNLSDITFQQINKDGTKYYGISIKDYLRFFDSFLKTALNNIIISYNTSLPTNDIPIPNKCLLFKNITFTLNNTLLNLSSFIKNDDRPFFKNIKNQDTIANSICFVTNCFLTLFNRFDITYDTNKVSSLIYPTPVPTTPVPTTPVPTTPVPTTPVPTTPVPTTPVPTTPVPTTPVPTTPVPTTPVPTTPVPKKAVSYTISSLMSDFLN